MYYIYVIKSAVKNRTYIGYTDNLQKRLSQHNSGYSKATRGCSDWSLIHSEELPSKSLAIKRERYLKSGDGRKVLKLKKII